MPDVRCGEYEGKFGATYSSNQSNRHIFVNIDPCIEIVMGRGSLLSEIKLLISKLLSTVSKKNDLITSNAVNPHSIVTSCKADNSDKQTCKTVACGFRGVQQIQFWSYHS